MTRPSVPPIIIIGMHRSGTSMVTRMLERIGLFVGVHKDDNREAHFFRNLNDWMMTSCGGAWDHPSPTRLLAGDTELRELCAEYIRLRMVSPVAASFLGCRGLLPGRHAFQINTPWGWKDPRNTFTLSVWREIFPDFRVIHVYRHGVDVAASLLRRQTLSRSARIERFRRRRLFYAIHRRRGGFSESYLCEHIEGGVALWLEYMREAREQIKSFDMPALEVCYELFLADPLTWLSRLADFAGLEQNKPVLIKLSASVRSDRAFAFRTDDDLIAAAARAREDLRLFGYGPEGFLVKNQTPIGV